VISDCRFKNEILIPRKKFGEKVITIRLIRTNYISNLTQEQQQHESETALDNFKNWDYIVTAKDLDELYKQLDIIYLLEEKWIKK
jgi:hypothetical protein